MADRPTSSLAQGMAEIVQLCDNIEGVMLAPQDLGEQALDLTQADLLLLARTARSATKSQMPIADQVESAFHAGWQAHGGGDHTQTAEEAFTRYLLGKETE